MPGQYAQPEVRAAIRRFKDEAGEDDILLYWLLGSGTPPYKMSKDQADYKLAAGSQRCDNCEFAYSKVYLDKIKKLHYICSQIRGAIRPEDWCRFWRKGKKLKREKI